VVEKSLPKWVKRLEPSKKYLRDSLEMMVKLSKPSRSGMK